MKFISFEGIDGCGKTSIVERLLEYYQSKNVYLYKETNKIFGYYAKYGFTDFKLHTTECVHLFYFQRLLNLREIDQLKPEIVICDRYYDSTWVYGGENENLYDYNFSSIFKKPDLTIFIDPSINTVIERIKERKINTDINESADDLFEVTDINRLEKYRKSYIKLYERQRKDRNIVTLNTDNLSIADSVKECSLLINELIKE